MENLRLDDLQARSQRVRDLVPPLGQGRRWYDFVYRSLGWCLRSWPRKILPLPARRTLTRAIDFVIPFHEIRKRRARETDDPIYSLQIPEGESVSQGGLWVVEFFPPSLYSELERQLKSNGWDKHGALRQPGANADLVARARTGQGWVWARIGDVMNPDTSASWLSSAGRPLSHEFKSVQLSAVQIGKSITAVVAFFVLSEPGAESLNRALRTPREPYLVSHGLARADIIDRRTASIRATRRARRRLHDEARSWLEARCKGYFASTNNKQPVIDLTLFGNYDPLETDLRSSDIGGTLAALGLGSVGHGLYISPQLPGGVLVPDDELHQPLYGSVENSWGFIGSVNKMHEIDGMDGYGSKLWSPATIAHRLDDHLSAFLIRSAAQTYLRELRSTYVRARDSARARHGRYRASRLKNLRSEMLQNSLDLQVVARDLATLWEPTYWNSIQIELRDAPGTAEELQVPPIDFIEFLRKEQKDGFQELIEEDVTYRELMVTVASLGSSAEASLLGKRALFVALVTLSVAAVTLLVAEVGSDSILASVIDWWDRAR